MKWKVKTFLTRIFFFFECVYVNFPIFIYLYGNPFFMLSTIFLIQIQPFLFFYFLFQGCCYKSVVKGKDHIVILIFIFKFKDKKQLNPICWIFFLMCCWIFSTKWQSNSNSLSAFFPHFLFCVDFPYFFLWTFAQTPL